MSTMPVVRATLVQCISELQELLKPHLDQVLEFHMHPSLTYESCLLWVLAEELQELHGLFDNRHQYECFLDSYRIVYCELRNSLPLLSRYVSYYVAAPKVYADHNSIDLELRGVDLYIHYYRNPYEEPAISHYPS